MNTRLIESRTLHFFFVVTGALLLLLALVQLPVGIFIEYTRPGLPWYAVEPVAEGIRIVPVVSVEGEPDRRFRAGDVLVRINDMRLDSAHFDTQRWTRFLTNLHIGDTLAVVLARAGEETGVTVILGTSVSQIRGRVYSLASVVVNGISPVIMLLIGYIVLLRRPRQRQAVLFYLTLASFALYMLSATAASQHMPWWQLLGSWRTVLADITFMFFLPLLLHFLLVFPEEWFMKDRPRQRLALIYLPFILLVPVTIPFAVNIFGKSNLFTAGIDFLYMISPVIGLLILQGSRRRATAPLNLRVIRVVWTGMLAFSIGFILLILINHLYVVHNYLIPGAVAMRLAALLLVALALPLSFGYALLRYGFLDIHILFKRTTLYLLVSSGIFLVFLVLFLFLDAVIDEFTKIDALLVATIVTFVVATFAGLARGKVEEAFNRRFFREEYLRRNALRDLSRELLHILDQGVIARTLAEKLRAILELNFVSVVGWDGVDMWNVVAGEKPDDNMLAALRSRPGLFSSVEKGAVLNVNTIPGGGELQELNAFFCISAENGYRVCVLLGRKVGGSALGNEDLAELQGVAEHATLGWKNATLSGELREQERIKQDMLIAQHIQSAMLPSALPEHPVFDIASLTLPASEVGGDFYDFIPFPDGTLGLVVGDVSDKGVSAAMIMASTVSIVRFAAEIEYTPKRILELSNRRLYRDTDSQMFAAVCFALLNERTLEMRFTNAGLPKPLLIRNDEAFLIEWSDNGTHFPLGMVGETDYHEECLQLQKEDVLVLYTDGITERTNDEDEEFGIHGLRDTVRAAAKLPAQDILFRIINKAQQHGRGRDQYDDVTMIVLRVRS
ncbi:MAG: serine/threonine-protein phosphatase [Bacteroidetes bacterium]|nr:serine/threonine-protein phosphatase [Bacteroidota bacterium]